MKLLLTSSGLSKRAIAEALTDLAEKVPAETKVALIPIAANVEEGSKDWFINQFLNLWRFGYNDVDIVDPTAVGVDWQARLAAVDVVFVSGGNTFHLLDQIRKTGFDTWLKEHKDLKVYVGASAGAILPSPTIEVAGTGTYPDPNLPGIKDLTGLGWVDFDVYPHCTLANAAEVEAYAKVANRTVYAIDDQSAVKVVDDRAEVVSEGYWKVFNT